VADERVDRRGFIRRSAAASAGVALALHSFEEKTLLAQLSQGAVGASVGPDATERNSGEIPCGRIKDLSMSRVFLGGNLIGGWAHSRDLIYVSDLVKAYHTDKKIFETLELAEERGMNAILTNPSAGPVINRYWKERGGKVLWLSDCAAGRDVKEGARQSVDNGAHAIYVQGGIADAAARDGKVAAIGEALEYMKQLKVPSGLGAHDLETVKACVAAGFQPDFWVKTLHPDNYWSATPKENRKAFDVMGQMADAHGHWHDNMFCRNPNETIEYMKGLQQPWIAFKVLAAGAIHPLDGFKFAFEGGADFICVGMFDFQVRENAVIAKRVLSGDVVRQRPWRA
jgi:hypothetical protein